MAFRLTSWPPDNYDFRVLNCEAHIWYIHVQDFENELSILAEVLSEVERAKAASYHHDLLRTRYAISRAILRILVGSYIGEDPKIIQFQYNKHGKPALDLHHHSRKNLHFNVAHSGEITLIAFGMGSAIGVDCEHVRQLPDAEDIVERFFSEREVSMFKSLPGDQRTTAFYNCWTRKEAYLKALGTGLSIPLDSFTVSLTPDEPARLVHLDGKPGEEKKWTFKSWKPAAGYVAAVACRSTNLKWRFF